MDGPFGDTIPASALARLPPGAVMHLRGQSFHGRRGAVRNGFRYGVDYLLLDPDRASGPRLLSRDRGNLLSVWDSDHGGPPRAGRGVAWVRDVLAARGLPGDARILLLAQPRVLGHVFNPVSFWFCLDGAGALRVVVAEVSNTFGDRHSYLCHREDQGPITRSDVLTARKVFHVSPFQPISGGYRFRFDLGADRVGIWIGLDTSEDEGAEGDLAAGGRERDGQADEVRADADPGGEDRPDGDRRDGVRAGGDREDGDRADGYRSDGVRADGDRRDGVLADGVRADGVRAGGDRADGDRAHGNRAVRDRGGRPPSRPIPAPASSAARGGLYATLTGRLVPLTTGGILGMCLRRPFGSRRVLALIHWQALRLWWKGARFHPRPDPPADEVTR